MVAMMVSGENSDVQGAKRDAWVSTGEAREMLGVSKRVLDMLVRRRVLTQKPYIYDRRIKQIERADVERVLCEGVEGMRLPRRMKATTAQQPAATTGGAAC